MNLQMTAPYYQKINNPEEIKAAMRHIDNVLNKSGVGETRPVTPVQAIRLKEAHELLRKSLIEY